MLTVFLSVSITLHFILTYLSFFFFFNNTATTEIYTLSLHDALPILDVCFSGSQKAISAPPGVSPITVSAAAEDVFRDRKSTRLNSSHRCISYAVFCLKKKNKKSSQKKEQTQ